MRPLALREYGDVGSFDRREYWGKGKDKRAKRLIGQLFLFQLPPY